jgi:perosamine synthetase
MLVNNYNIPITKINLSDLEKEEVIKTLNSGWIVQGSKVAEFEKEFSKFVNVNYSVAVSSCTTALHLSLLLLDVKEGDEVIVPSFTFVATANVVEYVKAKLVFADIDIKTFNISIDSILSIIESKKYKRLKVLMPVNLFGLCAQLDKIVEIAKEYNLKVIEDSACSFASYINGKHSGTFGDIGCFSFHPRKIITTGEGGMLITNNEDIYKRAQKLRNHGAIINNTKDYNLSSFYLSDYDEVGYNYRMTDLQASLGLIQLKRAQEILDKRYRIVKKYYNDLPNEEKILLPYVPDNYIHSYQSFVVLFTYGYDLNEILNKKNKDLVKKIISKKEKFIEYLSNVGIYTRQGTHAVHLLSYYKNKYKINTLDLYNSFLAHYLTISLPLYDMNDSEYSYVIENIKSGLKNI